MGNADQTSRQNRTITVDFQDPSTYFQLISDGKAFVEFVLAFILSLGFQLHHKATCTGGGCLTRHSHYARVRLGGLTIWRIQCTSCKAVFTVLPHFVLRYRSMSPDVARQALIATHGGLSLEWSATICHISPMALYRLICALGHHSLVAVLVKCRLPLPAYILADEKHSRCLTDRFIYPPSSAAVSSGIWGTATRKAPLPSPSHTACFNRRPLSMSPRTRYGVRSPTALTAPSAVCGPCFQGHA
jgi:hypothetical protein